MPHGRLKARTKCIFNIKHDFFSQYETHTQQASLWFFPVWLVIAVFSSSSNFPFHSCGLECSQLYHHAQIKKKWVPLKFQWNIWFFIYCSCKNVDVHPEYLFHIHQYLPFKIFLLVITKNKHSFSDRVYDNLQHILLGCLNLEFSKLDL